MNKNCWLFAFFVLLVSIFTGCVTVPQYYTPSAKLARNLSSKQYDITFSLTYASDADESIGRAYEARLRAISEERLKKCGYFSTVTYKNPAEKGRYHIHFIAHYSMCPVNESEALGFFIGYTLSLIPTWQNMYIDLSAILMQNDKKIYSTSTSENLRCYIWLPLAPFGLLWNNWLAWTVQEKNCVDYLLNNLTEFQNSHFSQ